MHDDDARWLKEVNRDPSGLINTLGEWWQWAVETWYDLSDGLRVERTRGTSTLARRLALWCRMSRTGIDPAPILTLTRHLESHAYPRAMIHTPEGDLEKQPTAAIGEIESMVETALHAFDEINNLARVLLEQTKTATVRPADNGKPKRPCYNRDHTFLRWKNEERMTPAPIRDRWNEENPGHRIGNGNSGIEVVKTGLKKALRETGDS